MANTAAIAASYMSDTVNRTEAHMQQAFEDLVSLSKETPGGTARRTTAIVLSGDAFAPIKDYCMHTIDGEASAADNLATITATGIRDGFIIGLKIANAARPITLKNSGNIQTQNGQDIVLDSLSMEIYLRWDNALSKWIQTTQPDAIQRLDKIPGTRAATALVISVGGSITPTLGFHTCTSNSGSVDDLDFADLTNFPTDTMFLCLKATSGHTINVRHNQTGSGKFLNTSGLTEQLFGDKMLMYMRSSTTWVQIGSFGFAATNVIYSNGRLTASSTLPVPGTLTNQATGYLLPYNGNLISTFNGSQWVAKTIPSAGISLGFAAAKYCAAYRYVYDNAGTLTFEDQRWDGGSQVTKTITGITAANPAVVTTSANHGLSVGDWVFIDGVVGTMGTTTKNGVNSAAGALKPFKVLSVPTATTFSFGLDTTGLTYTSGGTVYILPAPPALGSQDGQLVKSGDATRRLVGIYLTGFNFGQCESSGDMRCVVSHLNRVITTGARTAMSNSHALTSNATPKLADVDLTKRKTYILVDGDIPPIFEHSAVVTNGASAVGVTQVFIDGLNGSDELGPSLYGSSAVSTAHSTQGTFEATTTNVRGLHSAGVAESTSAAASATFASNTFQAIVPW